MFGYELGKHDLNKLEHASQNHVIICDINIIERMVMATKN
jgi:hypothetical protein